MNDYPRILLVGDSIDSVSGGGITLQNLFRGWPVENLADLFILSLGGRRTTWRWLSFFPSSKERKSHVTHISGKEATAHTSRLKQFTKKLLFSKVAPSYYFQRAVLSSQLLEAIRQFNPELMYLQPAPGNLKLLHLLQQAIRVPSVVHFLDDWISFEMCASYIFKPLVRKYIRRELEAVVGDARGCIAIGQHMAENFEIMFDRKFVYFHNPVDSELWNLRSNEDIAVPGTPVKILYSGKIGIGVSTSLQDIAQAILELNKRGFNISFTITTRHREQAAMLGLTGNVGRWQKLEELPSFISSHDILVLPYDFDEHSLLLRKLSIPTKVSEYMASGIPILVYAPENTAVSKNALNEGWAYVVSENNMESLVKGFTRLIIDYDLRRRLSSKAVKLAESNLSIYNVGKEFRAYLQHAASPGAFSSSG